jgi:GcrA cell cycle regulator
MLGWSDERVEQLKKLWEAGLSSSQIAAELGGVTRNAVIGKIHRLGLSGRVRAESEPPKPVREKRSSRQKFIRVDRPEPEKQIVVDEHAANMPHVIDPHALSEFDASIPVGRRKNFEDLQLHDCRWPVGDPQSEGFFFCGGPASKGLPYCAPHCRVAYRPAAESRAERAAMSAMQRATRIAQGKARAERMRRQAAAE